MQYNSVWGCFLFMKEGEIMIDFMYIAKLISIMTSSDFYYVIKYVNKDYEVISQTGNEVGDSVYTYNKHFYFKKNKIYYWESKIFHLNKATETKIEVNDLYEIKNNAHGINKRYEMMYDDLLEELGPEYSELLEKRTDKLFEHLVSKEPIGLYCYYIESAPEIENNMIPPKLKRTKIKTINSLFLGFSDIKYDYCITYGLLDIIKVN